MRIVTPDEKNGIYLGRQGENLATQVQFDVNVAGWVETYGVGTWQLLNRRPSDPAGYPVEISVEDNIIKWDLTATDLKYAGCGTCELVYYVDEVVAKSIIYGTQILPAIDGTGEIPEPWESWIDEVEEARDEAQAAAEAAAGSASSAEGYAQDASASAAEASDSAYLAGQSADAAEDSADTAKDEADRAAELADQIEHSIDDIEALIPPQASPENQLADKDFVNSSIATNTANYISNNGEPFTSVAQLEAYSGPVSNNDYAFVTGTDAAGNTYYDRYKATVSGGSVSWALEYRLNNSSFTAAQWASIQSGITAALVASYNAHLADRSNPHEVTASQVGLGNVDDTSDEDKPVSTAQVAALALKADKVVDAVAGDFAALDENGNLTDSGISPSDLELVKEVTNDPANSSFDIAIQDAQAAPVLGAVLKGKTAAINQLANPTNGATTDLSFTVSDGVLTINGTTVNANYKTISASGYKSIIGHKYYVGADHTFSADEGLYVYNDGGGVVCGYNSKEIIGTATAEKPFYIVFASGKTFSNTTLRVMIIDLTLCGFTASETTDVATLKAAWLKKYGWPLPQYIPYNAGSIVSNNAVYQLHGKNLFDKSQPLGTGNITDDGSIGSVTAYSHTGYIRVKSGTLYTTSGNVAAGSSRNAIAYYDIFKNFISRYLPSESGGHTFETPANCAFIRMNLYQMTLDKLNEIQLEEGSTATTYEPFYNGGTVTADSLNGIGTVADEQDEQGNITRLFAVVDLGTLTYYKQGSNNFYALLSDTKTFVAGAIPNLLCAKYPTSANGAVSKQADGTIFGNSNDKYVVICDSTHSADTVAQFKTAMSGVYLAYELAAPTTDTTTGASLETKEGYNLLRPVSGDLQSGEVSMTYVKSSYLAKLIAWIRSIL